MVMIMAGPPLPGARRAIIIAGATYVQLRSAIGLDRSDGSIGMLIDPSIEESPVGASVTTEVREGTSVFDIIERVRNLFIEFVMREVTNFCNSNERTAVTSEDDAQWVQSVVKYVLVPTTLPLPAQVLDDHLAAVLASITDYLSTLKCLGKFSLDRLETLKQGLPS